jgi:hypothetical protein
VNSNLAIVNGALAGKPQFFGDTLAEAVSAAAANSGWNIDSSQSIYSDQPWSMRSGSSGDGTRNGLFAFSHYSGVTGERHGHRTILSGY